VGGVGLDAGPRYYKSLDVQKVVFRRILECCAESGGKILTIHSVRCTAAVLDMLEAHLPRDRSTALHWQSERGQTRGRSGVLFLGER
jgi:TatD DNase family protein